MMETSRSQPRHTTEQAQAPNTPEADRRAQERVAKEQTDAEIAERVSSPPEQPTPTQEEADAYKEGEPAVPTAEQAPTNETAQQRREREQREHAERQQHQREQQHQRDVKPDEGRSGYQTR
jgi:hypothetical protein